MNRKKKMNSILRKRDKKANAKLAANTKPRYISKSEREAPVAQEINTEEGCMKDACIEQEAEENSKITT